MKMKIKGYRTYFAMFTSLALLLLDGFANNGESLQWIADKLGIHSSMVVGVLFTAIAAWMRSITTTAHISDQAK